MDVNHLHNLVNNAQAAIRQTLDDDDDFHLPDPVENDRPNVSSMPSLVEQTRQSFRRRRSSSPNLPSSSSIRGMAFSVQVTSCHCTNDTESLVRCGYWPSSPRKPTCAISICLLKWIATFLLEMQSSLKSICQSLKWLHGIAGDDISYLYHTLTDETFEEFRHFYFLTSHLQGEGLDIDDGTSCPACPKEEGNIFVSFDANFGLVRKSNSGTSSQPLKHATRCFLADKEGNSFVDSYQSDEVNKEDTMFTLKYRQWKPSTDLWPLFLFHG
ncbi:uncharacterized protein [Apostichopus japonicus]|uniref:uncharacterized protein isoform X1 n=1 Tax=Stichopus japonicus TaxID=307972 RepID=UPI003AB5CE4E